MDMPLEQGRRVLDAVITERRQRAAALRELAARDDTPDLHRRAYLGMAEWVDGSVHLVEQAAARLAELDAVGHATTGREQMDREFDAHGEPADRVDSDAAQSTATCDAVDAATGRPCPRPGVLWRSVRGRPAIEAADWRVCREVHAAGPLIIRGRSYADNELTRPRRHEQAALNAEVRPRERGRSL
jgi:hypothetical protein